MSMIQSGRSPVKPWMIYQLNSPPDHPRFGFGPHLMVDMYGCLAEPCDDPVVLQQLCLTITDRIGMHVLGEPHVYRVGGTDITHPEDNGASAVVVFAESHFTVHGFPGKNFCVADIFSCKPFNAAAVVDILKETFQPKRVVVRLLHRGEDFPRSGED